jgi:hypothetical protein
MNVEIGAESAQFPEKEYINGIAVAVLKNNAVKTYYIIILGHQSAYCTVQYTSFQKARQSSLDIAQLF